MIVRWSREARQDLLDIESYLLARNPAVARRVISRIFTVADDIADFPGAGLPGAVAETRERLVLPYPYVVVYHPVSEIMESGSCASIT